MDQHRRSREGDLPLTLPFFFETLGRGIQANCRPLARVSGLKHSRASHRQPATRSDPTARALLCLVHPTTSHHTTTTHPHGGRLGRNSFQSSSIPRNEWVNGSCHISPLCGCAFPAFQSFPTFDLFDSVPPPAPLEGASKRVCLFLPIASLLKSSPPRKVWKTFA